MDEISAKRKTVRSSAHLFNATLERSSGEQQQALFL
jgi:hypothetical protein